MNLFLAINMYTDVTVFRFTYLCMLVFECDIYVCMCHIHVYGCVCVEVKGR